MRIVYNSFVPFRRFYALSFCGLVFIRHENRHLEGTRVYREMLNHEEIHWEQQKELGIVFFFVLYVWEWLWRLVFHTRSAYRGISFEREAKRHEKDMDYLMNRKHFAQWRDE